jgi:hypothetical protein
VPYYDSAFACELALTHSGTQDNSIDFIQSACALLASNGHVPLQLSHYLRQGGNHKFSDGPEFEILNDSGEPEVETDLLALVDRRLLLCEAKINNTFGSSSKLRSAAEKRAKAAQSADIRNWARRSGYEVASRGRIRAEVVDAFRAAH